MNLIEKYKYISVCCYKFSKTFLLWLSSVFHEIFPKNDKSVFVQSYLISGCGSKWFATDVAEKTTYVECIILVWWN